jgi:hypothetical protein
MRCPGARIKVPGRIRQVRFFHGRDWGTKPEPDFSDQTEVTPTRYGVQGAIFLG